MKLTVNNLQGDYPEHSTPPLDDDTQPDNPTRPT